MNIRRLKAAFALYNFFHKDQLKHNLPLYKKYGLRKRYFDPISSADFNDLKGELNRYDRLDSAADLPNHAEFRSLSAKEQEAILPWSANGYAVLNGFFNAAQIDAVNAEVERLVTDGILKFKNGRKLMFAIHKSPIIKAIGEDTKLKSILKLLMGKEVDLFQSINFILGSEQRTHSDSIHMSTFPHGNLIAIWVALEDIGPDQGPLHYYPGSHKLPYVMNAEYGNQGSTYLLGDKQYSDYEDKIAEILADTDFQKQSFTAKKGDVFIWHANLLHGGNKMNDKTLTRKSVVFHYYASDAICYHEVSQRPTLKR